MDVLAARIRELPLVFLDLETTGLQPEEGHEIIEFGAVKTQGGEELGSTATLIRPTKPIPPESVKVHGITDLFVMGAPSFEMAAGDLLEFIGDSVIIAHNAPFDVGFLAVALQSVGRKLPDNLVLDSVCLSKTLMGDLQNHKLDTLKKTFGVHADRAHRALDDARALAKVFQKMLETKFHQLEGGPTFGEIASKAAPLFRFQDFADGLPSKVPEHRALVRWALREKGELELSYERAKRPGVLEEIRIAPLGMADGTPPLLRARLQPKGDEIRVQLDRIRAARRAI